MAKLFIVGTPIGNLNDMTYRAVETLRQADIIACEDTRHSLPLLKYYDVHTELTAYHKFNEEECALRLIGEICSGKNVALITDAGMPSISDPGAVIVSKCRAEGVEVEVVPGPTALASAVALSGIQRRGFTFLGFLPEKNRDRTELVQKAASAGLPLVLYVAPHDLFKTAAFLLDIIGDRNVYIVRELTKIHECVTETSLANFDAEERGEIVMIIDSTETENPLNKLNVAEHLNHYISLGVEKKDAVKFVAADRGVPKNEVYKQALDI